jgi:hypothetical protein
LSIIRLVYKTLREAVVEVVSKTELSSVVSHEILLGL